MDRGNFRKNWAAHFEKKEKNKTEIEKTETPIGMTGGLWVKITRRKNTLKMKKRANADQWIGGETSKNSFQLLERDAKVTKTAGRRAVNIALERGKS